MHIFADESILKASGEDKIRYAEEHNLEIVDQREDLSDPIAFCQFMIRYDDGRWYPPLNEIYLLVK